TSSFLVAPTARHGCRGGWDRLCARRPLAGPPQTAIPSLRSKGLYRNEQDRDESSSARHLMNESLSAFYRNESLSALHLNESFSALYVSTRACQLSTRNTQPAGRRSTRSASARSR